MASLPDFILTVQADIKAFVTTLSPPDDLAHQEIPAEGTE